MSMAIWMMGLLGSAPWFSCINVFRVNPNFIATFRRTKSNRLPPEWNGASLLIFASAENTCPMTHTLLNRLAKLFSHPFWIC